MNSRTPTTAKRKAPKRGRPAIYRTENARIKATRKRNRAYQTSDAYKARRKERYATDPEYREVCLQRAREVSEQRKAGEAAEYAKRVNSGLRRVGMTGTPRRLANSGKTQLTYTIAQCAEVLCRPAGALREWIHAGRFPAPAIPASNTNGQSVQVYSIKQVTALAQAAVTYLRTATAHLTATREDAIIAFHRAMRD